MPLPDGYNPTAPAEKKSEYNGLLSYAGEWHSLTMGLFIGFVSGAADRPELMMILLGVFIDEEFTEFSGGKLINKLAKRDIRKEPWYAAGGSLIGYAIGWMLY